LLLDVKLSGLLVLLLRSGTNNFEGSAYFLNRNESISENTSIISWYSWKKKIGSFLL
jgi:hypothetical protein